MTSLRLAALALMLLMLPTAALAKEDAPVVPSAYASVDHVTYYLVAGFGNGSAMASNPGSGDTVMDFAGCAFVQLRPELDRGRISIAGLVDGFTPMRVEVGDFDGDAGSQGPIATNLTIDKAYYPVLPDGQTARAEVVGHATAEMKASEFIDYTKMPPVFVMANFTDPVSGAEELDATLAMAADGIRDDATQELQAEVTRGDDELHIVLSSPAGAAPSDDKYHFNGPSDVPNGVPTTEAEYTRTYEFLNTRFGGTGTLTFTGTTKAPPGFNAVSVAVRAPDGSEAGNTTVEWSVLAAGAATIEFPADQMGFYSIIVTGKMLLGSYGMDLTLGAAPAFQLDFWWEDVERGAHAQDAYGECQRDIGLRAQVVAGTVDRAPPTTFPLKVILLSIVAAAITALVVLKLVQDQVSSGEFRKQFK